MSKIEWTGETWNPLAGCTEISPGCANCYAATMARRLEAMGVNKYAGTTKTLPSGKAAWTGKINLDRGSLNKPLDRKKPTTYFVNSMSDLFHEDVPDEFIDEVFAVMSICKQHTFQVLTKRADRLERYVNAPLKIEDIYANWHSFSGSPPEADCWPLPNVWIGFSVEKQAQAYARIPHLRATPAAIRFLSCEPLLGPVNLHSKVCRDTGSCPDCPMCLGGLHWVIVGGESGPGARPCHIEWVRSIVKQCKAAGVACFVKQLGANIVGESFRSSKGNDMAEWPADLRVREMPALADK